MRASAAVNSPSPQHRSTTTMPGRTPISTRTVTGSGHNACHQSASGIVVAGKKPTIMRFSTDSISYRPTAEWGIDTVIVSGTTTENCCHATARDAMFRNYRVVFLSDATATYDYPDRGFGPLPNADVHHATLIILAASTAHVMSVADMSARVANGRAARDAPSRAA